MVFHLFKMATISINLIFHVSFDPNVCSAIPSFEVHACLAWDIEIYFIYASSIHNKLAM